MDAHEHPRSASKATGRKGKAVLPSEEEEQEDEDRADVGTLHGVEDDNVVNLSYYNDYVPTS